MTVAEIREKFRPLFINQWGNHNGWRQFVLFVFYIGPTAWGITLFNFSLEFRRKWESKR